MPYKSASHSARKGGRRGERGVSIKPNIEALVKEKCRDQDKEKRLQLSMWLRWSSWSASHTHPLPSLSQSYPPPTPGHKCCCSSNELSAKASLKSTPATPAPLPVGVKHTTHLHPHLSRLQTLYHLPQQKLLHLSLPDSFVTLKITVQPTKINNQAKINNRKIDLTECATQSKLVRGVSQSFERHTDNPCRKINSQINSVYHKLDILKGTQTTHTKINISTSMYWPKLQKRLPIQLSL